MVDPKVLLSRTEQIEEHLKRIRAYEKMPLKEFLKDPDARDIVEYNLFQIVNHLIDMIQHIVVDEEYGYPQSAYEACQILYDRKVLTSKDLNILKKMIGFRNIVGHDYISLNREVSHEILKNGKKDIETLVGRITRRFL